jgi:glycosyltransferase involved in cell wall biosynthesis
MSEKDYHEILASSDVVILPYDQNAYGARSSGILAQALAAGKPVVVPADTWMASQIDPTRGRTFEAPSDLTRALASAIENIDALAEAADRYKHHWRRLHTPDALLDCLMAQPASIALTAAGQSGEEQRRRPTILYVMNADPLVTKMGSSRVALNQLEYLTRCGYRVFGVFMVTTLVGRDRTRLRRMAQRAVAALDLCYGWVIEYDFPLHRLLSSLRIFMRLALRRYALDVDVELRQGFNLPQSLTEIVTNANVDATLLNYVQNWPLVDRLHLQHKPVIVETHDLQARQYALRRTREVSTDDVETELSFLSKAAAVICISDSECTELKKLIPNVTIRYIPPFVPTQAPRWADLAGCTDVREVIGASQPARADWCLRPPSAPDSRAMDKARWGEAGFDLLYVSSSNHANVESFSWFYHEVFLPHLVERRIRMVVAGNIDQAIEARGLRHPGVTVCGPVAELGPLYAAAKLVVLPITSGAGTSIKTVEALSFGKPVVATTEALRGLSLPPDALPTWDTADAFGREVLRLLDDRAQRERAARLGQNAIRSLCGRERYYRDMNAVFATALKGRALRVEARERPNPPAFVEWSPAVAAFNRLMRGQIESESLAPCDVETVHQGLAAAITEGAFRALYDALMIRRDAPLLQAAPWLRESLARIDPSPPDFSEFVGRL